MQSKSLLRTTRPFYYLRMFYVYNLSLLVIPGKVRIDLFIYNSDKITQHKPKAYTD